MLSKCENFTEEGGYFHLTSWWTDTFAQDVITSIGIIGNMLICAVLLQKKVRKNTFNQLRVALALFDIIMLITMFLTFVLFRSAKDVLQAVYPIFLWPLMSFCMTQSVFMTVAIALERYEAINNPYTYKSYQEYRALKYITSLSAASFILSIGKFFEFGTTQCIERPGLTGVLTLGPIFENQIYAIYNMAIFRVLILGIIPVIMLTYLYTKIFLKIQEHKLNMASQNSTVKKKMMREQRLAITFAGVVIVLLVCTIPGWLLVIKILIDGGKPTNLEYYETVNTVRLIFYTMNSAINIFIYACLDKTFRRELKKFFKCDSESDHLSTTYI